MKVKLINKLPKENVILLRKIGKLADTFGVEAYIVGGVVRDIFLGRHNLDIDILVEKDAIGFAKFVSAKLKAKLVKYPKFLTATIILPKGKKIDFATARREVYLMPGALPLVTPGAIQEDLARRDFTINALAVKINNNSFGELFDYFSSVKDIKNKNVRVLHDLSFIDDPTRIFRAVRFAKRFDFQIEKHTQALIKNALKKKAFLSIKPQRMWNELRLILNEPKPKKYILELSKYDLNFINRGLKFNRESQKLFDEIDLILNQHKKYEEIYGSVDSAIIYFIALVSYLKEDTLKKIAWKFSINNRYRKSLFFYKGIDRKKIHRELFGKRIKPSTIFKNLNRFNLEILLLLKAASVDRAVRNKIDRFLKEYQYVKTSLTGNDLKKAGVAPGKKFKDVLDQVLYEKLDGKLKSRREELVLVDKIAKKL